MNDLYGIDPQAPSNLRDLSGLLRLFGPSDGRFIADFPMAWRSELRDHMKSLSDLNQKAVEEWLVLSQHAILPNALRYKPNLSWAENASNLREHATRLIGPAGKVSNLVEPLDQILTDPNAFPDASGALIPRTISAYVAAAKPILMVSRKIVLIDPYFNLRSCDPDDRRSALKAERHRKFLKALLEAAVQENQCQAFEIHHAIEKSGSSTDIKNELISIARSVGASAMAFSVRPVEEQHARYLLGLKNGLHFDHGFDIHNNQTENHVAWIGKAALEPLLKRFT
ncbi:MAG: hypothetical protein QE279_07075 [Rhodoferax sp.]|nr:hypothetical protein [Rhodoferax sp.]